MKRSFSPRLSYFLLFSLSMPLHAETLGDLVERSIDAKALEISTKAAPVAATPASTVSSIPPLEHSRNELRAEDLNVYGIAGVGDDLKAKVRFKDSMLVMSRGQRFQGWTLASITPDTVVFELLRPGKSGKGEAESVATRKIVYLSGAAQGMAGTPSTSNGFSGGMPAGMPSVPALTPLR